VTNPPAANGGPGAYVDLHLHSTASDGMQSPAEVVEAAVAARLHTIALTDHDTVAGVAPARQAAGTRVHVVAGVELSAYQGDDEVHLLGLHLNAVDKMHDALEAFRDARVSRGRDMVARLNAIGVRITFDEVLEIARDAAIGRPHVAKVLVENGWARDFRDAFDRYLGAGRPAFLEKRRLTLGDAIAMVHGCGGVAVLAHPGSGTGRERLAALQSAYGLDGSEVIHPAHSDEDRRRLLAAVTSLGMIPSGGSDSHGNAEGPRVIGAMHVPYEWLLVQQACVATRRRERQVIG
jgi:hypothetical protein